MKLYSIQLFAPGAIYSKPIGQRLIPRYRAQKVVSWLRRNNYDAYIAPVKVTATP
jgi:hypothetical protein